MIGGRQKCHNDRFVTIFDILQCFWLNSCVIKLSQYPIITVRGKRDFLDREGRDGALDAPMRKRALMCVSCWGRWVGNGVEWANVTTG